jgi:hypothetical protein
MKLILFLVCSVFLLTNLVSANFVCGVVEENEEMSGGWLSIIAYYSENPTIFTNCNTNPENKYCCDMEEIGEIKWKSGKEVSVEAFDEKTSLVGGPVKTILTEQGLDLLPNIFLEKGIIIEDYEKVMVNKTSTNFYIALANAFDGLEYSIFNNQSIVDSGVICRNCNGANFSLVLPKGKNEIIFSAIGKRNMTRKIIIYSLDYLSLERVLEGKSCKNGTKDSRIISGQEVKIKLKLSSSHDIEGILFDYFPSSWNILKEKDLVEDFSLSHKKISFSFSGKNIEREYSLIAPKILLNKNYNFTSGFEDKIYSSKVFVFPWSIWPKFFSSSEELNLTNNYFENEKGFSISPTNPLVRIIKGEVIELVAIYPKKEMISPSFRLSYYNEEYFLITSIKQEDIERIIVRYKMPKGKEAEVYQGKVKIYPNITRTHNLFDYYDFELIEKGKFSINPLGTSDYFFNQFNISFRAFASWVFPNNWAKNTNCFKHFGILCNFADYFYSSRLFNIFNTNVVSSPSFLV